MGSNGAATSTDPTVDAAALRVAASTLVERYEFASRHGLTFQNARDLARALGYKPELGPASLRAELLYVRMLTSWECTV